MIDYQELKRLAEAAKRSGEENGERWPQDDDWFEPELISDEMAFVKAVSPAVVLALIAEVERLEDRVKDVRWQLGQVSGVNEMYQRSLQKMNAELENLRGCDTAYAEDYDKAWRHDLNDKNNIEVMVGELAGAQAMLETAYSERDQLKAEVEALRKDAERYRWLRNGADYCDTVDIPGMTPDRMDSFIDAAMSKEAGQ